MREILKKLYLIVSEFYITLISLMSVLLFSSRKAGRSIKGLTSCEGRSVSILANGPSFKTILNGHMDLLSESDVLMLNHSACTPLFQQLKPKYYILVDPNFFNPDKLYNPKSNEYNTLSAINSITWELILFLPYSICYINAIKPCLKNDNLKVVFFNATKIMGLQSFVNFALKRNWGVPSTVNVIVPAIQMMIILGYERINLYGADFTWLKNTDVNPENNKFFRDDVHHYEEKDTICYYENGWYIECLRCMVDALDGLYKIRKFADYKRTKVINRSKGSFIDAFSYENPDYII